MRNQQHAEIYYAKLQSGPSLQDQNKCEPMFTRAMYMQAKEI
jgi:hypothetical protein